MLSGISHTDADPPGDNQPPVHVCQDAGAAATRPFPMYAAVKMGN